MGHNFVNYFWVVHELRSLNWAFHNVFICEALHSVIFKQKDSYMNSTEATQVEMQKNPQERSNLTLHWYKLPIKFRGHLPTQARG